MDRKLFFTVIVTLLLGALGYVLFLIFSPFISSLIWAGVMVILAYPLYLKVLNKMPNRPELASLIMCLGMTLVLVIPATFLALILVKEIHEGSQNLSEYLQRVDYQTVLSLDNPFFKHRLIKPGMDILTQYVDLESVDLRSTALNSMRKIPQFMLSQTQNFFTAFSSLLFVLAMVEINMFFLFRDGKRFIDFLKSLVPIAVDKRDLIFERMREVIKASMYGNVGTALAQGVVGGAAFLFLGVPSAILWMVLMTCMSFLPLAGPFVVWIPVAIWLFLKGSVTKAIILTAWGMLVVGSIDNVLRPILIKQVSSKENQLNTLVLFLGVLGGISVFGFLGIVMAPLVIVMFLTLLELLKAALANPDQNAGSISSSPTANLPAPLVTERSLRGAFDIQPTKPSL